MTKQLLIIGTAVMTTLLALVAMWQFRIVIVYVLISLAVVAAFRPLIMAWSRRSIPSRLLLVLVALLALGTGAFLFYMGGRLVIGDIQQLAQSLSIRDQWRLPVWLQNSPFQRALVARLPPPTKLFEAITGDQGQLVLPALLNFSQAIEEFFSGILVIFFLSIYWSINQIHFERLWLSLLPAGQRKQARGIWRTIEIDVGAYIRSEVVQSLLAALLLGLGYWAIGSPYPALLALIGALAWLMPVVGAPLAVIMPLLIGLLTSMQLSIYTVLYTVVVLIVLEIWIEPRLSRRKWNDPILTLVILLVMADAFGLLGIIVAPPLSAICQILWNHLVSRPVVVGEAAQVSDLKARQVHLVQAIQEMDGPPMALVTSSMDRLSQLIEKAIPILPAELPTESSGPFDSLQPVSSVSAKTSRVKP